MDNLEANIMDKSMRSVFGKILIQTGINSTFSVTTLLIFQLEIFHMKPPKRN